MFRLSVAATLIILGAGCSGDTGSDPSAAATTMAEDQRASSVSQARSESPRTSPSTSTSVSAAASVTEETGQTPAPESALSIELPAEPGGGLGDRWPQLATFGYYGRPAANVDHYDLPDIVGEAAAGGDLGPVRIELVELNWGIDSSGLLVAIDGPAAAVAETASAFEPGPRRLIEGDGWLGVVYRGGLAADFELDDLVATVEWIMNPDHACALADAACPLGSEVAFPHPPPRLVVAELAPGDEVRSTAGVRMVDEVPFAVDLLPEPVSQLATTDRVPTWIGIDGQVRSRWDLAADQGTDRGRARVFHSIGSILFAADGRPDGPDRVRVGYSHDEAIIADWAAPDDWTIDGLAFIGSHGMDDYQLIVTADLDDGSSRTVAIPVDVALLQGGAQARRFQRDQPPVDLAQLPALNPADRRWSDPQRNAGLLTVIEEHDGEWSIIGDPLGQRSELLRSNHPLISYAVSPGAAHIVATVDGPQGPSIHWGHHGEIEVIGHGSAAVGWLGDYLAWTR